MRSPEGVKARTAESVEVVSTFTVQQLFEQVDACSERTAYEWQRKEEVDGRETIPGLLAPCSGTTLRRLEIVRPAGRACSVAPVALVPSSCLFGSTSEAHSKDGRAAQAHSASLPSNSDPTCMAAASTFEIDYSCHSFH